MKTIKLYDLQFDKGGFQKIETNFPLEYKVQDACNSDVKVPVLALF